MEKLERYVSLNHPFSGSFCLSSDVKKLEAELAQVKADLRTVCDGWRCRERSNLKPSDDEVAKWKAGLEVMFRILNQKEEGK